jgi:hypothetical protein
MKLETAPAGRLFAMVPSTQLYPHVMKQMIQNDSECKAISQWGWDFF